MRQKLIVGRHVAPGRVVNAHSFRIARLHAVIFRMRRVGIYRVGRLLYAPPAAGHDHRILNYVAGFQRDLVAVLVLFLRITSDDLKQRHLTAAGIAKAYVGQGALRALREVAIFDARARGKSRGEQRRPLANRAMTIDAAYFNSSARFVVEHTVAVRVLPEMTVNAVHPFFEMNVVEMDGLAESIRIFR